MAWVMLALALACERQPSTSAGVQRSSPPNAATSELTPPVPPPTASTARPSPANGPRTAAGIEYVELLTAGAQSTDALPLVIAIHGLGDRPERFAWLLRELPVPARVIVPRGLDRWHDGFSWFPIRLWQLEPDELARGIERASAALADAITELRLRYGSRRRVVVVGFSQGGMLALALAVHHPDLVGAAFPVAGWLPRPLWPATRPGPNAPRIVSFHGSADPILPVAPARDMVRAMQQLGYAIELREEPHTEHAVSPAIRAQLLRELARCLAS